MISEKYWGCGSKKEAWEKYCSFLDLNVDEFMAIQNKLLMEHLSLLTNCELGKALTAGKVPKSPDEFRNMVPLTDYSFYEPFLADRREDALPVKPHSWVCTSSTGGVRKWVPVPPGLYDSLMELSVGMMMIGTSTKRGEFSMRSGDKLFAPAPPPPYFAGFMVKHAAEKGCKFNLIPPMDDDYEVSDLPTRAIKGFSMAMEEGIDLIFALPSVMVKVGEQLAHMKAPEGRPPLRTILRAVKGMILSRLARRPLMPKDLWKLKLCVVSGMDLEAFRDRIKYYWGIDPYEMYALTEFLGIPAFQVWNRKAMTPQPFGAFFEFIPEEESVKSLINPDYQPSTCLLNELEPNKSYEVVFTNFYGGAFARYRPKDMITVVALHDPETGIQLPQWVFKGRADKLIDLGGFTRMDEKTVWLALEDANIKYEEWMASKEADQEHPVLHVYISTDTEENIDDMQARLHASLKKYDSSYADLEDMLKWTPLRLTVLPLGVFSRWQQERIDAGADPLWVKEQRMQPPAEAVQRILKLAQG